MKTFMIRSRTLILLIISAGTLAGILFLMQPPCRADDFPCWNDAVRKMAAASDIPGALGLTEKIATENAAGAAGCHSLAHAVGETAFLLFVEKKPFEIGDGAGVCGYGFYHGFLEKMVHSTGDSKEAAAFCDYADRATGDRDAAAQCFHGIGHGLVADPAAIPSLKEAVPAALAACSAIAPDEERYFRCASGVFNAWSIAYSSHPDLFPEDPALPFQFCAEQSARNKPACYGNLNVAIAKLAHNDFGPALGLTLKLAESTYLDPTVRYLAAYFVSFSAGGDPAGAAERLAPHCAFLPDSAQMNCVIGIAHGYLELGGTEAHGHARKFCEAVAAYGEECAQYVAADEKNIRGNTR